MRSGCSAVAVRAANASERGFNHFCCFAEDSTRKSPAICVRVIELYIALASACAMPVDWYSQGRRGR